MKTKNQFLTIVMGVSGTGKSSVGQTLAKTNEWVFLEADDFHSKAAKDRMASGQPLNHAMRGPWIERICAALETHCVQGSSVVLSCSALSALHRDQFRATTYPNCIFLFLNGPKEVIAQRMAARKNHFMPAALLDSQFEALDWPTDEADVIEISIEQSLDAVIAEALKSISRTP